VRKCCRPELGSVMRGEVSSLSLSIFTYVRSAKLADYESMATPDNEGARAPPDTAGRNPERKSVTGNFLSKSIVLAPC